MSATKTNRSLRSVSIADHLWDSLEQMAQDMGVERDALVNQALFTWVRLNGYYVPGVPGRPGVVEAGAGTHSAREAALSSTTQPLPTVRPETKRMTPVERPASKPLKSAPPVEALDDEVEPLESEEQEAGSSLNPDELFNEPASPPSGLSQPRVEGMVEPQATEIGDSGQSLFLSHRGQPPVEVTGDRFVIGRGKHCDFIIESNRVSREHAAVTREGSELFIEDLKSSNGTWLNKQRITKRKISDGDEFFLGSEPLHCTFR